jgi:hypothetical protein
MITHGAAGVYWDGGAERWWAAIRISAGGDQSKSTMRHLGTFVNEVDAALAYDQAAREHHGKKAMLKFPHLPPVPPQGPSSAAPTKRTRGEQVRPIQDRYQDV